MSEYGQDGNLDRVDICEVELVCSCDLPRQMLFSSPRTFSSPCVIPSRVSVRAHTRRRKVQGCTLTVHVEIWGAHTGTTQDRGCCANTVVPDTRSVIYPRDIP
jgi:hypothetical protein